MFRCRSGSVSRSGSAMGMVIRTAMGMATVIRTVIPTGIRARWFTRDRGIIITIGITGITGPIGLCTIIESLSEKRFS